MQSAREPRVDVLDWSNGAFAGAVGCRPAPKMFITKEITSTDGFFESHKRLLVLGPDETGQADRQSYRETVKFSLESRFSRIELAANEACSQADSVL